MIKVLLFTMKVLMLPLSALLGSWLGGQLRFILTGTRVQTIQFHYTTDEGHKMTNSPVATKFYPALLSGFLGKPRWLFAFLGGILAGGLIPDHLERLWLQRVIVPIFVKRFYYQRK
jgi:hypothetical protein